jgi:hypothetical protein
VQDAERSGVVQTKDGARIRSTTPSRDSVEGAVAPHGEHWRRLPSVAAIELVKDVDAASAVDPENSAVAGWVRSVDGAVAASC